MGSVVERLVREQDQLLLLLAPPFDRTPRDPGYIKGYPPGIRENGGQYTHAALWSVLAFAELGDGDRAGSLFNLLNPIHHADTPEKAAHYKVEPYVVAADVYSSAPHTGLGGWTWYTGSAGWMYRVGIEGILGLHRQGAALRIDPCIPRSWPNFQVTYRSGTTSWHIRVENPSGVSRGISRITLDGKVLAEPILPLSVDGGQHHVEVTLGPS
jgi:cyclic beta-1,2-glucan synthetase